MQSEDDLSGTVLNASAIITALAGPGEIRLSDVTRAILGAAPESAVSTPTTARFEGRHILHRLARRART